MEELYTEFAYDDAFRTMAVKCDDLLLPFLNYTFGEHYDSTACIVRGCNEHLIDRGVEVNEKRITDSLVQVSMNGITKKYHTECESSPDDGTILIRMFEYDAQIALEERTFENYTLNVRFPHTSVLFLRSRGRMPEEMTVNISTPGGRCSYPVKVVCVNNYSLDEIFEKELYFLLPFYLFTKEKELPQIELDSAQADALIQEYEVMLTRLDKLVENNILSAFSRGVIIKLIKEVNEKLTNKYVNINRRVGDYMGGRVLDLDIIRAHDSGIAEGRQEGRAEGYEKRAICDIKNLMKNMKLTAEQAMEALGIDKSEFSKYMTML